MIDRKVESSFIPVNGGFGITVNYYIVDGERVRVINAVKQHEPQNLNTSFGLVKNKTLSRISDKNFQTEALAERFVKDYLKDQSI